MRLNKTQEDELNVLAKKGKGTLDAREVVDFARDESTSLHRLFEWDNEKAGDKYRIEQARHIIAAHVVIMPGLDDRPLKVRAFMSLPSKRGEQKFKRTSDVLKKKSWRDEMMAMAKSELDAVRKKYEILSELQSVWDAIYSIMD